MAYTRAWDEAEPDGSEAANTIDDIIRNLRVDLRERIGGIFGVPTVGAFDDDPIVPISLTLTGTAALATVTVSTALAVSATSTLRSIAFAADSTYDIGTTSVRPSVIYADLVIAAGAQLVALQMAGDITTIAGGDIGKTGNRFAAAWFTGQVTGNGFTAASGGLVVLPIGGDSAVGASIWIEGDEIHFANSAGGTAYKIVGTPE